jgi:GxxExxY protein
MRKLTSEIINAAIEVHKELGPGLLERVYQKCMFIELQDRGFQMREEVDLPIRYKNREIDDLQFRLDLLVEDMVIVELKSVQAIEPVHKKQLLSYLRLANKDLGLLINFNVELVKDGIYRIANSPKE